METIRLYSDNSIELDLSSIAKHLNQLCINIKIHIGKSDCVVPDKIISYPTTYQKISNEIKEETADDFRAIIITRKQFNNNYFFQYSGNLIILSLFGWNHLTSLSINNGVVFFIADFLALKIDHTFRHNKDDEGPKPECIYDFGWNKSGVDIGMRSSLICPDCIQRINTLNLNDRETGIFEDLKKILNDLGNASKWETDIIEYWEKKHLEMPNPIHQGRSQVFISYSHADTAWLKRLKVFLKPFERNSVIHVWDDTQIQTGQEWRKEIKNALKLTKVAVLLFSADFLASDFIAQDELPPLLEAAQNDGASIMPIILKPCGFDRFPNISKFQAVNSPSKTLVEMEEGEQERFLLRLTEDILSALGQ